MTEGGEEEEIEDEEVGREYDEQPGEDEVLEEDDEDEDEEEEEDDDENENEGKDNDGDEGGGGGNGYVGDQNTDRGQNADSGNDGDKPGSDEAVNNSPESDEVASMQFWIERKKTLKIRKAQTQFRLLILST